MTKTFIFPNQSRSGGRGKRFCDNSHATQKSDTCEVGGRKVSTICDVIYGQIIINYYSDDSSDEEDVKESNVRDEVGLRRREDPLRFAPTGDVYSYFVRRKVTPASFTMPLR